MGATSFETSARGENINEAYKTAVEDAIYDYGHDPYNATISTTNGVIDTTEKLLSAIDAFGLKEGQEVWEEKAFDNAEKWKECWGAKHPNGHYIFAGIAAE